MWHIPRPLVLLQAIALVACASLPVGAQSSPGVVVIDVPAGSSAAQPGLKVGDWLLDWRGDNGRSGAFSSSFDFTEASIEEFPRGPVTLRAVRDGRPLEIEILDEGPFDVRPQLPPDLIVACDAAGEDQPEAVAMLVAAAERSPPELAVWLLVHAAFAAPSPARAPLLARAVELAPDDRILRLVHRFRGWEAFSRRDLDGIEAAMCDRLNVEERLGEDSLMRAEAINNLAFLFGERGNIQAQEAWNRVALDIRRRLAPGSSAVAESCNNLGTVMGTLGLVEEQSRLFREALDIRERRQPNGAEIGTLCSNLGLAAMRRGDLGAAERWLRRSIEIKERSEPASAGIAISYNNLGKALTDRGDIVAAEEWYRRALAIWEKVNPNSLGRATVLNNLADISGRRGDIEQNECFLQQALELRERLAPGSIVLANSLQNQSKILTDRDQLEPAERLARQSLAIRLAKAPGSIEEAFGYHYLGRVLRRNHRLDEAEACQARAIELRERFTPNSYDSVFPLDEMAAIRQMRGDRKGAIEYFERAVAVLERQQRLLGGTARDLANFRSRFLPMYARLVGLLVDAHRDAEAAFLTEAAHGRATLALLAERSVDLGVPVELLDAMTRLRWEYERALAGLSRAGSEKEYESAADRLRAVEVELEDAREQIRRQSPESAALSDPQPLTLAELEKLLGPGDVLVSWLISGNDSVVVGVSSGQVKSARLPLSERELRAHVAVVRRIVQESGDANQALRRASQDLLAPLYDLIAGARRLILVPDGALWQMPLGLLPDANGEPIARQRSLSIVSSASVLSHLIGRRKERAPGVVAFGDPPYPAGPISQPRGRAPLARLPATRAEVVGISREIGDVRTYLGDDATEKNLRGIDRGTGIVHLAAHGLVDDRLPLESAIALDVDPDAVDNDARSTDGLLQAWEIFESVRLDADLVVLSACDTALGEQVAGEGLMGLTRAFQFAGARSVLASLWEVDDESTAELMIRFYRALAAGRPKDDALRQAQLELAAGPIATADGRTLDATHPFHWAAFQLYGDGK